MPAQARARPAAAAASVAKWGPSSYRERVVLQENISPRLRRSSSEDHAPPGAANAQPATPQQSPAVVAEKRGGGGGGDDVMYVTAQGAVAYLFIASFVLLMLYFLLDYINTIVVRPPFSFCPLCCSLPPLSGASKSRHLAAALAHVCRTAPEWPYLPIRCELIVVHSAPCISRLEALTHPPGPPLAGGFAAFAPPFLQSHREHRTILVRYSCAGGAVLHRCAVRDHRRAEPVTRGSLPTRRCARGDPPLARRPLLRGAHLHAGHRAAHGRSCNRLGHAPGGLLGLDIPGTL